MSNPDGISGTYGVAGRVTREVSLGMPGRVSVDSVAGVAGTRSE